MSSKPRPTPEQESLGREIRTPGIILIEGRTGEMFLRELIEKELKLTAKVEARTFGEKEKSSLTLFLNVLATKSEFRNQVTRLGIIRDAETEVGAKAFAEVASAINAFNKQNPQFKLPVPAAINTITTVADSKVQVAVFVLPDCKQPGMLETLCLNAVEELERSGQAKEIVLLCVRDFFKCLEGQGRKPRNPAKADFAGYALAMDVIDPQLGRAAQKGAIPWHAATFDSLKNFVQTVANG
jgi:hypothetical protein